MYVCVFLHWRQSILEFERVPSDTSPAVGVAVESPSSTHDKCNKMWSITFELLDGKHSQRSVPERHMFQRYVYEHTYIILSLNALHKLSRLQIRIDFFVSMLSHDSGKHTFRHFCIMLS